MERYRLQPDRDFPRPHVGQCLKVREILKEDLPEDCMSYPLLPFGYSPDHGDQVFQKRDSRFYQAYYLRG